MIFNMVGGGGGSLKNTDAVLIVSVPTGSTVTATKGGVTITPTIWVQNADNTLDSAIFSIPSSTFDANAWTVTATLGADSASDTIVINSNEEFEMELSYGFFLYNKGTIETSVSGGLSNAYSSGVSPTTGVSIRKFTPHNVYRVYLKGKSLGLIKSKKQLEEYIDKKQAEIKEKYDVDKVYIPSDLDIIKENLIY